MLKPDAIHRGLAGQIVARFEQKGFKLVAMKFMRASVDLLSKHYADLSKKPFFPELIRYLDTIWNNFWSNSEMQIQFIVPTPRAFLFLSNEDWF